MTLEFETALNAPEEAGAASRPVAVTVRLPRDVYVRLKLAGLKARLSNQDVLMAALKEWLERAGA